MATGFFFKRSADPGAPQLTNTPGSLIAVLDWALDVNNAGGHWEKVFTGTNKAVYRARTGQRFFLRVDDNGTQTAQVRGYGNMTDVDTGTEAFPAFAQRSGTGFFCVKTYDATVRSWRIVGDSRFFLFVPTFSSTVADTFRLGFGEATPYDPADTYCSLIFASYDIQNGYSNQGALFAYNFSFAQSLSNGGLFFARTVDGMNVSTPGQIEVCGQAGSVCGNIIRSSVPVYNQVRIWDGSTQSDMSQAFVRGVMPYLYAMPYGYNATVYPYDSEITAGASTFRAYVGCGSTNQYALLRTSNDEQGRV